MSRFTQVTSGLRFPEGPIAMPDGSVLVVEVARGTLTRIGRDGNHSVVATLGGSPNGAAIGPNGKCYVCNSGGYNWHEDEQGLRPVLQADDYSGGRIEIVDLDRGTAEVLYAEADGRRLKGPNDLVFDQHGGFWFTDHGKSREFDQDRGVVYYASAGGTRITPVIHPMVTPNGVGLSPEGDRLYVSETITGRLWSFDLSGPGEIVRRPWPSPNGGELVVGLPGYQLFDSLAVDASGNVCIATLIQGGITIVSPRDGATERIDMPDIFTTNICFGGPSLKIAYITLGASGRLVSVEWPRQGLPLWHLQRKQGGT
jgi:gluconolactonase